MNPEANTVLVGVAEDAALYEASLSSALVTIFRGKFCDILLRGRSTTTFKSDEVLYDVGDRDRRFFFIGRGFVKVGTVTQDGREIIYDIRRDGDVVGELCACQSSRRDRAVALEQTDAIAVPYPEILGTLQKNPELLSRLVQLFCDSLSDAYEQINTLTAHHILRRLINVLLGLATNIGRPAGEAVQLSTYLTQEEIAQMVGARRERVSTALNLLRRRGMVQYSNRGHLLLRVQALENYSG